MADFHVIPSIDELRRRAAVRELESRFGAAATVDALRAAAAAVRTAVVRGESVGDEHAAGVRIEQTAAEWLDRLFGTALRRVINATGVVLHTNLGRAPLSPAAIDRMVEVAAGYASLEYDIERGARGRRDIHAEPLLRHLTGAEAAVVVNNNAAATLIVLAVLAAGREVIVSRGELVEIGGGFRVPDVMAQSGAILREVGTTNKTRAADYAAAVNDRTALILRVHPSNFTIEGFTERPSLQEMVAVARRLKVPMAEDLGSGWIAGERPAGSQRTRLTGDMSSEPAVEDSVAAGVDICCFSGDKLLGGPQAGIMVGTRELVDRIRHHPLMRALRVDKLTYAALEATLREYAAGRASMTIPVRRMLAVDAGDIRRRAERTAEAIGRLPGCRTKIVRGLSTAGGGSGAGITLDTWLIAVHRNGLSADALAVRLRRHRPPVIARIENDAVVLDLRTVDETEEPELLKAFTPLKTS